ncbi:DNA repair protein RadC [Geopseudomonas sagittaria]|uniref:DNA repair protein RadC n=1 Tax=Geopseudomonas sagittaria TaxID=1135990 RepID=A0A1I5XFM7_9GAMM|nr:DNA repair protein RadC [Pseudomonas sagittaria]MCM2329703.1 DNA repair protein RadC [Pseudomonas sagittaria]SFQ30724.1 DNA repair protein RadC [Pseudomonas sagittaria]
MNLSLSLIETSDHTQDQQRAQEDQVIAEAMRIIDQRMFQRGAALTSPDEVRDFLKLQLAMQEHEVFAVVFLDTRHRVLAFEVLFQGSIDGASVYPRQVVKRSLYWNSAAVIFTHNHPSGCAEPSQADRILTQKLKDALALVEVRVLDHFIVGEGQPLSLAEYGWM